MNFSDHMLRAIALASESSPHPNPRVGAVVLDMSGAVVGEGHHVGPGSPHAEVVALQEAGQAAEGGTIVVTLEPCAHQGRTPPCTEAILQSGVKRLVYALGDPDTSVAGGGATKLAEFGLEVVADVEAEAASRLDPGYFIHRFLGRPRVTIKWAMTLDGQVAAADGTSQWISGEAAREDAHRLRAESDAVMVGAGTLRSDDPLLTVRVDGVPADRQPRPVVVLGTQPVPDDRKLWSRDPIVIGTNGEHANLVVAPGDDGLPDLRAGLEALAVEGIVDLLVEGGPTLAGSLWRAGLVDRCVVYLAGGVGGGTASSPLAGPFATVSSLQRVTIVDVRLVGPDLRVEFEV